MLIEKRKEFIINVAYFTLIAVMVYLCRLRIVLLDIIFCDILRTY